MRPSALSRSNGSMVARNAKSTSGTREATNSRTATSPAACRSSHGSRPSSSIATKVCTTKRWSNCIAFLAALRPAWSPSNVKTTSPRLSSWSCSSRRSSFTWSSPNAVPQVATAVSTPARWQAITSV
jgi:hypothetical protein